MDLDLSDEHELLRATVRAFAEEVRAGMAEREAELREALGMEPAEDQPLSPADAADLIDHPASDRRGGRSTSRST